MCARAAKDVYRRPSWQPRVEKDGVKSVTSNHEKSSWDIGGPDANALNGYIAAGVAKQGNGPAAAAAASPAQQLRRGTAATTQQAQPSRRTEYDSFDANESVLT